MVGVIVETNGAGLSADNNAMIAYMLKQRENHARSQRHDYSHVFRKKTRFELFRLSAIAMAIEFAYAAETSFVSPILLQIGIEHKHMTMLWGVSPLIGFFVSPLLGSLSDRCHLSWGRRRPIITLLSLGITIGLVLVPYGKDLGVLLGDIGYNYTAASLLSNVSRNSEASALALVASAAEAGPPSTPNFKFAAILTIVGMVLLDFDADTCQTPARTYLLDMCSPDDQSRALTMFTLFAGVGGTIGYAIGGIDWETTHIGSFLGGNIPTVFGLVTIIFVVCYLITITTFREIPLKLLEQDDLLRPLSAAAIKRELQKNNSTVFYIKQAGNKEEYNSLSTQSYQNGHGAAPESQPSSVEPKITSVPLECAEAADKPVSLAQYLKSIFVMPHSMRMLALTNLLCWMGHVTYCLYFTDFVGEAVYKGDPTATPHSEAADLYEDGVRFGCWGLSVYALSCSVYSLTVTKLIELLGTRTVYITGIMYYGIGMLILGIWPTKWGVILFSTSAGILYGTLFTLPYMLVARYHARNCFHVRNGETVPLKQSRGLGTDVAIISSMVFIAQFIVSLGIGPLVSWMQTTCAILYASTFLSFMAAIAAMFVLYI